MEITIAIAIIWGSYVISNAILDKKRIAELTKDIRKSADSLFKKQKKMAEIIKKVEPIDEFLKENEN